MRVGQSPRIVSVGAAGLHNPSVGLTANQRINVAVPPPQPPPPPPPPYPGPPPPYPGSTAQQVCYIHKFW